MSFRPPCFVGLLMLSLVMVPDAWAQRGGRPPGTGRPPGGGRDVDRAPARPQFPVFGRRDNTEIIIEPGRVTSEIACAADRSWSYRLYAPRDYTADRRWPVLFVIAPGGGSTQTLRRYVDGAELNGWLVAVSIQAGRTGRDNLAPVEAMVKDVAERLPVERGRFYLSGFADGAQMAMAYAAAPKEYGVVGVLACGGGDATQLRPSAMALYALCGTNSPRRREVSDLFDPPGNPIWRLEFVAGANEWGEAEDIAIGMTWLNAATLRTAGPDSRRRLVEKERFERTLIEHIVRRKATDLERAHDWAECLTLLNSPDVGTTGVFVPHPVALELREDPRVKRYREGRSELTAFAMRFIAGAEAGGVPGADAVLQAQNLAFRYRESRLRPLFERIGQSVAK